MRVLLINSNLRDDFFAAAPIGLCYIASATESAGHEVKVLDLCFKSGTRRKIRESVKTFSPDVVGISVRNIDNCNMLYPVSYVPQIREMVRHIRQVSNAPVVLGGAGASLIPEDVLRRLEADYIVVSDGEKSFIDLLSALSGQRCTSGLPGIGAQRNGQFDFSPPDLSDCSPVRPDVGKWIDIRPYLRLGAGYNVQSYRGCGHNCIYCLYNLRLQGFRIRLRPPEDVVDELEEVVMKHNPDSFDFVDSVFNEPLDHCVEILEEIIRRPWKASFTATAVSPKNLDDHLLRLMWRAGFKSFHITPESASDTMLRSYQKPFNADDVIKAAEATNRTQFNVLWFFLIGGPDETNQTLQESLDFCLKYLHSNHRQRNQMANLMLGVRLYPGTKLWERSLNEGIINHGSDPLEQLWYLSRKLDLPMAFKQMLQAARISPEILSGMDERFMALSGLIAFWRKLFRIQKPGWAFMVRANEIFRRMMMPFAFRSDALVSEIRKRLELQGYPPTSFGKHSQPLKAPLKIG